MLLALALALLLASPAQAAAPPRPAELHVVQSNVGNINVPGCAEQVYKLCLRRVEERAARELQAIRPDTGTGPVSRACLRRC